MLVVPRKICRLGGSAGSVVEYVNYNIYKIIKIYNIKLIVVKGVYRQLAGPDDPPPVYWFPN
jgi:hypothetical protein